VKTALAAGVLICAACAGGGHRERDGDRLYLRGNYGAALRTYSTLAAARGAPRLWAKTAAAALHAGRLDTAVTALVALAEADSSRRAEAGDGLAEVARRALREHRAGTLAAAVSGLLHVAPSWRVTSFAYALVQDGSLSPAVEGRMLPLALAGAPDAGTFDSLLLRYGALLAGHGACADAAYAYRGVARRTPDPLLKDSASAGYATCALRLGLTALDSNDVIGADRWFGRAARADSGNWTGRRALIGLGDARLRQGDPIAAAIAWQRVASMSGGADSLGKVAQVRLRTLSPADTTRDSAKTGVP
jgi:hypothetical protein